MKHNFIHYEDKIYMGVKIKILILTLLFSSCIEYKKTELSISNGYKDKIFSEYINPLTEKYDFVRLREKYYSGEDFEVRVWISTSQTDGFIINHIDGYWSAIAIKEIDCKRFSYYPKDKGYNLGKINLHSPKSGWENTWQKLLEAGIVDLPNSNDVSHIDGISYIVETNQNGKYRIYFYSNPNVQKTEEARRVVKIGEIIADEFGLDNFKIGSLCLEQ